MSTLDVAIENLYSAFSDAMRPSSIEGCDHCINRKEIATLLAKELKQLEGDDLSPYASSAFLTVGDVPDYLYFLPRILEISAKDDGWWPTPEVTGRAISETNPNNWTIERSEALREFLAAKIRQLMETNDVDTIDEWLCGIARMGLDVRPFLAILETSPATVAGLYRLNCRKLDRGKLSNEFWELPNEGHNVIVEWLRRDDIKKLGDKYWP